MGRISNDSTSLREKKEKIMDKILDKIDMELSTMTKYTNLQADKIVCENVQTLVYTFNSLDIWLPEKNPEEI